MPIHEPDPWRVQYFEHAVCPPDVDIPTDDPDSWRWYPAYRWVYDKMAVALSQGLDAGPHGVPPPRFPVFSKPITNLKGMGVGSRLLDTAAEYAANAAPGHMWMTLLHGRHVHGPAQRLLGRNRPEARRRRLCPGSVQRQVAHLGAASRRQAEGAAEAGGVALRRGS